MRQIHSPPRTADMLTRLAAGGIPSLRQTLAGLHPQSTASVVTAARRTSGTTAPRTPAAAHQASSNCRNAGTSAHRLSAPACSSSPRDP